MEVTEQTRPAAGVDEEVAEIYARIDVGNGLWSDMPRLRAALDRSAQECAGLRQLLSDTSDRATRAQLACEQQAFATDELRARLAYSQKLLELECKDSSAYWRECEHLRARLTSYDACLTQVREEMPEVSAIAHSVAQYGAEMYGGAIDDVKTLLAAIDKLQSTEGANRNAIKLHLETIAARDGRIAELESLISCCNEYLKDGETPAQGIARNRQDALIVMSQWTKALAERDTARDCLLQAQNSAIEISEKLSAAEARERGLRQILQAVHDDAVIGKSMIQYGSLLKMRAALAAQPAAVDQQENL